ncbi:MAG: hypothetical protein KJ709_05635 [Nanoarchaeota archaeon]|nr:hypothetical protein [Nanoarchaeota archaeon]
MGMSLLTIVLYLVYCYGLGFSVSKLVTLPKELVERHVIRFGLGLGILPILSIFLNLIHVPLDFKVILALALVGPVIYLIKDKKFQPKGKPSIYAVGALIIFLLSMFIYAKGAFSYPYLEDDDPWGIAKTVKYISVEKTAFVPEGVRISNYIDPYPPSYFIFLAYLHQTSPDLMWTMKFFNALTISLAVLFFFFFARRLMRSSKKAFYATLILAMLPSFLSHFIWAIAMIMPLFFIAMYCYTHQDRRWYLAGALVLASMLCTQPATGPILGILLGIYWIIRALKKLDWWFLSSMVLAGLLSLMWWLPMLLSWGGVKGIMEYFGGFSSENLMGSASRIYTFADFFVAKPTNMINNPIGIGAVAMLLALVGLVFVLMSKNRDKHYTTIAWFAFALITVNGVALGISFFSFRMWMVLAIPIALLAAEGLILSVTLARRFYRPLGILVLAMLLFGLVMTSGYQKYRVNTDVWPPGGWIGANPEVLPGLLYIKDNLPLNTKVFPARMDSFLFGMNMHSCEWCDEVIEFRTGFHDADADSINDFLKEQGYRYLWFDGSFYRANYGDNETLDKLAQLSESLVVEYQSVFQGQPTPNVLFRVR